MVVRRKRSGRGRGQSRPAKRRKVGPVSEIKKMRRMNRPLKRVLRRRTVGRSKTGRKARAFRSGEVNSVTKKLRIGRAPARMSLAQVRKIATTKVVMRYQNIAAIDRLPIDSSGLNERGAHWLGPMYVVNNTITGALVTSPRISYVDNQSLTTGLNPRFLRTGFHLYNLTHTGLKTGIHHVAYQPFIDMADGSVSFAALGVQNNTVPANITTKFQVERASGNYGGEHKWIRNDWYEIRLGLRNAQTQQTWFDIWIFQFKDGYLDPLEEPSGVREREDRHAFYQGLARGGYVNPMFPQPNLKQPLQKVRVLRKLKVGFEKSLTIENDVSPEIKYVRMFIRDGRVLDYQWSAQPATGDLGGVEETMLGTRWVPQGAFATPSDTPRARARTWMMIRAYDPRLASGTGGGGEDQGAYTGSIANNTNITPSYDICLRKSETVYAE